MKNLQEYYADQNLKSRYEDYRAYVLDCFNQLSEYMGSESVLEELTKSLSIEALSRSLDYIVRNQDLNSLIGEE